MNKYILLFLLLPLISCLKKDEATEDKGLKHLPDIRIELLNSDLHPEEAFKFVILDNVTGTKLYNLRIDLYSAHKTSGNYKVDVLLERYSMGVLSEWSSSTETVLFDQKAKEKE